MELKFSIITPSFNSEKYIIDTIESVLLQKYKNIEHIIIDGGSSDRTIDIISKYSHIKWISEKDSGPSDAIRKGFEMADGDIFVWLNSDDYFEPDIFKNISNYFSCNTDLQILIGNITFVDKNKDILVKDKTYHYDKNHLVKVCADVIRQPSTFFTKGIYEKVGGISCRLKVVFDYDLFIRMLDVSSPKFVDENFAYVRDFEETISRRLVRKQAIEILKVSKMYGGSLLDPINKTNLKKFIFG
jgi:glycosyltransferase involved in cell wall biosynthesis